MDKFNNIEFGNRLRSARIKNEFSQDYVGMKIGKSGRTISKYERGTLTPSIKVVSELCDILNIYSGDLYESKQEKIANTNNSNNPFKVNRLYLYYKGYVGKRKIGRFKFIIDIQENNDYVEVKISDYQNKKIFLIGHMLADENMVTIRTENYKPNCPRFETNQIILNISEGTSKIVLGTMFCTNGYYEPNIKKCIITKKDMSFSDDMMDLLKTTDEERKRFLRDDIWIANIEQPNSYEINE